MADSKIEWTDRTWNPVVGCSVVSPGCTNCYAMKMAGRIQKMNRTGGSNTDYVNHYDGTTKVVNGNTVWTGKLAKARDDLFLEPLRRKKPTMYFVNSMGDLFHEDCPDEWIDRVFAVMALAPQHTFQVLTKRAERMARYFNGPYPDGNGVMARIADATFAFAPVGTLRPNRYHIVERPVGPTLDNGQPEFGWRRFMHPTPLPNVWLGVSTEDQKRADERIPLLLQMPAAVRFISAEPLLGPIDLETAWHGENALGGECWGECGWCSAGHPPLHNCRNHSASIFEDRSGLDWVIVGGESGPNARPMHPEWALTIRDQCRDAEVPFFFKQWGAWAPNETARERMIVAADGDTDIPDDRAADETCGEVEMARIGKSKAGRLLDGKEHNAFPEART